ncbi:sedoheptulose 7-phosphate cyclase [Heyndrickxia sp. FSL W8-0423]|uniref:sedoheptulose 7-phosphate cyclase n=1 Tax=Heyndrickxia sp. FSL W8-0423 TaxID=2921601 RepID=UPI0030F73A93
MEKVLLKENKVVLPTHGLMDFHFDVYLDRQIFNIDNHLIKETIKEKKCLIIISETIEKLYLDKIKNYFNFHLQEYQYRIITIKTTEINKNINNVLKVCESGMDFGLDRKSLMVGIGGGILLDIVGFAASMYKRKLNYLRIPTTLLAQIDAGIGIKNGVNHKTSKNILGSFHNPVATINDISLLKTLDKENLMAGLAEIIKMALIFDLKLFELIESNFNNIIDSKFNDVDSIGTKINEIAISLMQRELEKNYYEKDLERLVDFGHTFSPFIEESTNYSIKHGLAVAMDIAISTEISFLMGLISGTSRDRILNLLLNIGYDLVDKSNLDIDELYKSLDKISLHRGGNLNLILPIEIGKACIIKNISDLNYSCLQEAIKNLEEKTLSR